MENIFKETAFRNYLNTWDLKPSNFVKVTSLYKVSWQKAVISFIHFGSVCYKFQTINLDLNKLYLVINPNITCAINI
jgi:hypothetical protein